MKHPLCLVSVAALLTVSILACQTINGFVPATPTTQPTPTAIPTPLPPMPVQPGEANPDEPVFITGDIPYTSPFFASSFAEPFVLLEDEAGFARRDRQFAFSLQSQAIGPVVIHPDQTLTYSLSLPSVPQGTLLDVDNNGKTDTGVQVFAISYWSNTWDGPFLEKRDGTGWSNSNTSIITDPERDDEISGGLLVVWAPDGKQSFPTGFGDDNKLFTPDDPAAPIPAGYDLVDLNKKPFRVYKEAHPKIDLLEGDVAVNDYSSMSYSEAFESMFTKVAREYPFTQDKNIDWPALHDEFAARVAAAKTQDAFYKAIRDFTWSIPDAHVGLGTFNAQVFAEERGSGFGLVLAELSDGSVIATHVLPNLPANKAGIQVGAQILTWDDQPVSQAISKEVPYFGPFSTEPAKRLEQVAFLTRVPPGTSVKISYQNPNQSSLQTATLRATQEIDSLILAVPALMEEKLTLPVEGKILEDSGLGYIRVNTFLSDSSLMARLWEYYIKDLIDKDIPGVIIDIRQNGGGLGQLANDFAGYFFDHEIELSQEYYYNEKSGKFEVEGFPAMIDPGPMLYKGRIAVLVSPDCVSACEGFAYALTRENRSKVVGNFPTAGAFGEVGRGQYKLPDDLTVQFPTGRPETMDGKLLIEGTGIMPDITVPVTTDSALGKVDAVLEAAVEELTK
jgi:C-terminal processing protease CtpA/Prc